MIPVTIEDILKLAMRADANGQRELARILYASAADEFSIHNPAVKENSFDQGVRLANKLGIGVDLA